MLNDVNHLTLIGTLGADVDLRETKNGKPMAILSIATSSQWIDETIMRKRTLWNKVFFFGEAAVRCRNYKKGMKVHVTAEVGQRFLDHQPDKFKTLVSGVSAWVVDLGNNNRPSSEPDLT